MWLWVYFEFLADGCIVCMSEWLAAPPISDERLGQCQSEGLFLGFRAKTDLRKDLHKDKTKAHFWPFNFGVVFILAS